MLLAEHFTRFCDMNDNVFSYIIQLDLLLLREIQKCSN